MINYFYYFFLIDIIKIPKCNAKLLNIKKIIKNNILKILS